MATTYTPIATTTLGSNAVIEFSSIPNTYTDLRLIVNGGITNNAWDFRWRFNSDAGANYSRTGYYGDGTSVSHTRQSSDTKITTGIGISSNQLTGVLIVDILGYSGSKKKYCLFENGANNGSYYGVSGGIGVWHSTSAINTIYLYCGASNDGIAHLYSGTTATLYGILRA